MPPRSARHGATGSWILGSPACQPSSPPGPARKRAWSPCTSARLATATTVGLIETSGGQEDVQSFAWEAAENLRTALRHSHAVTACELLTAYQAHALSDHPAPSGCRPVLERLEGLLGPVLSDRPFGEDIERLMSLPGWP